MTGSISKLPKWAREKIESLQRENARLYKQVDDLKGKPGESDFYYTDHFDIFPLPKHIGVRMPTDAVQADKYVEVRRENSGFSVRCREGNISVQACASNSIFIYVEGKYCGR